MWCHRFYRSQVVKETTRWVVVVSDICFTRLVRQLDLPERGADDGIRTHDNLHGKQVFYH